jgi:hypothetical protein
VQRPRTPREANRMVTEPPSFRVRFIESFKLKGC